MAASKRNRLADEGPLSKRFRLTGFTDDLIQDLADLRAGKISTRDAAVRADMAKNVLRALGLIIQAQKYLEGQALVLPSPPAEGGK